VEGRTVTLLKKEEFDRFNPSILGLGDVTQTSMARQAIAAVLDLEGFTNFCKQIDPQLSVPIFLKDFLDWIFAEIRQETCKKEYAEGVTLWHTLPFLVKFMGDGLLILWDTSTMSMVAQHNIITSLFQITHDYSRRFLPKMKRKVCDPPTALRCGIAKGTVYSVGDGNDFVGSCINLAARLQKLDNLHFAFSRRGFDPEEKWTRHMTDWVEKIVNINGTESGELVYIRKSEFDDLIDEDKRSFRDP
jgi:hypothetical protein